MMRLIDTRTQPIEGILTRQTEKNAAAETAAAEILQDVRARGDAALIEYTRRFDKAEITSIELTKAEWDAACRAVPEELYETLRVCAANIRAFHEKQKSAGYVISGDGVLLGQRVLPLERVGIYIPGGRAAYPSTVLMNAIPAKLAGVGELVMTTPPSNGGSIAPVILAAARLAGVDRVFKVGGAQAIAALAYGTQTIPAADKITGPGNAYVAAAKRLVYGKVDIDMIAGPSEILVIADAGSDPSQLAADLLSQAEHDPMAAAVLISDSRALLLSVRDEVEAQLVRLPKADICRKSIDDNGLLLQTGDLYAAVDVANAIAPEHLELCVDDPLSLFGRVKHAGSIFLGRNAPEALGDYFAGPNHTLPTSGTARFSSPLSVEDFVKRSSFIYYTKDALDKARPHIERLAESEGLHAHAASVARRFDKE